MLYISFG